MKKDFIFIIAFSLLLISFILPSVFAIDLTVNQKDISKVMVVDMNQPAVVTLEVTNNGPSDTFQIINLAGLVTEPADGIHLDAGETKQIQLKVYPRTDWKYRGFYSLEYFFMAQSDSSKQSQQVELKISNLKDMFEIGSTELDSKTNTLKFYVLNKDPYNFGSLNAKFTSPFFTLEKNFSLAENEKKIFEVQLNKEDFKRLMAGLYSLNAEIVYKDKKVKEEGIIKFVETSNLVTTSRDYGIIVNTKIIEKTNEGNIVSSSQTVIKKNIISRLFTTFSPQPDIIERQGVVVFYTWDREIKPGESLEITIITNWLFPFLLVFFIVVVVVVVKMLTKSNLVLHKKISFVKAKGGEFALKVSIYMKARDHLEKITITDSLPPLVKLYEKFGGERPTRYNEKLRRLEWNFETLEAGESRILSYLIYSKVGVLGKFALPEALGVFEKDGKIHETSSNKAFFMAEQTASSGNPDTLREFE